MCDSHLRGEHAEHHMFLGTMKIGKSMNGYFKNNLLQLKDLITRHDILAEEMLERRFKHESPLSSEEFHKYLEQYAAKYENLYQNSVVDIERSKVDLFSRCEKCRERLSHIQI